MTRKEAWAVIQEHEFQFEIEDSCFGDGSQELKYMYVLDSKNQASEFKNAIECILNDVKINPDYPKDNTENIVTHEVLVIEDSRAGAFGASLTMALDDGWKILSTSCGFIQSERYDFKSVYQAVLQKGGSDA